MDISAELTFKTSRSSGAGGQKVNKVKALWKEAGSPMPRKFLTNTKSSNSLEKLSHRLNREGILSIHSPVHRTQLANKEEVIEKFNKLVEKSLEKKKARIATRPTKAMKEKRLENKKQVSTKKENRRRISW